jgi:hypothetical protein
VPLRDYLEQHLRTPNSAPPSIDDGYLAGWHFMRQCPELGRDLRTPTYFKDNWIERVNSEVINFDSTSIFIGHPTAETPLHTDSFYVSVWLGLIEGGKTIRLVPEIATDRVTNGLDTFDLANEAALAAVGVPIFEAVIEKGDLIYIPPMWWHQVRNSGVTIAVSTNYVSPYHFLVFEQQLRAKLLTPLERLASIKTEAIAAAAKDDAASLHRRSVDSAKYIENERLYLRHVLNNVESSMALLGVLEGDG